MTSEDVAASYAALVRYADDGRVTFRAKNERVAARFETQFERHARFRFELRLSNDNESSAVEWDGGRIRAVGPMFRPQTASTLAKAIACLTGVSFGAAYVVPQLLLGNAVGTRRLWPAHGAWTVEERRLSCATHVLALDAGGLLSELRSRSPFGETRIKYTVLDKAFAGAVQRA